MAGSGNPVEWPNRFGRWLFDLPAHLRQLGHLAAVLWWPWLPLVVLLVLAVTVAASIAHRALWRRAVAGGYWLSVIPPRTVDPAPDAVWRLLVPLVGAAYGGRWRLVRPPLAFEIHAYGGRLTVGVWLPGWVAEPVAAGTVAQAWPGSRVDRADPPTLGGPAWAVAGYRLHAGPLHPQTEWLVNDTRPRAHHAHSGDPDLGAVFAALGTPGGAGMLQVLVRPAPGRRLSHLRAAAARPVKPPRTPGQLGMDVARWVLLAPLKLALAFIELMLFGAGPAAKPRREPPDAVQREAMRHATGKLGDGPHLLAAIRVGVARTDQGVARSVARQITGHFGAVSRALHPVRLPRPGPVLAQRWAAGRDWLLLTPSELGVLAHLPADPARYGFVTAALHRTAPTGAASPDPERPGHSGSGWTRHGWTPPPGDATPPVPPYVADDPGDEDNETRY